MHFMPDNSYFQHKGFQSPFSGGVEGGHSPSSMPNTGGGGEGGLGEPRVHRIPIQVETRGGATTTATNPVPMGYSKSASSSSPTPSAGGGGGSHHYVSSQGAGPSQSSNFQPQQHHPQHPQQQHPQPNPFISATSTSSSPFDSRPAAGGRNIEIPIQIAKSSSSPPAPSKKVDSNFQGAAAAAVNESASDPAIADPNQVYAMGYEPLAGGNSAANSNNAEKQKNEGGKKETPFDYVKEVLDDLKNYESQVEEFSCASSSDKGYRYLDEMLTLCILRLDCINIDGNDELRKYRKSAINEVNRVAAILESKVSKTESTAADEKTPSQQNDSQGQQQQCSSGDAAMTQHNGSAAPPKPEDSQTSAAVAAEQAAAEPKNKKEAKKLEKVKAKKEKEEKEKAEKAKKEAAAGEKKEGRRIILFRGKNKNKAAAVAAPSGDEAAGTSASAAVPGSAEAMDLDTNNNDLKDGKDGGSTAGGNSSDQASETASTSTTSSTTTLQGKETAV